jgi:predicted nucleic acid-binding protein
MILLDTNVILEAMTREPHPRARAWLDAQPAETLFLSSITAADPLFGIGGLPTGKRKNDLAAARVFAVASRDASAYAAAGLAVIDPWRASAGGG